MFGILLPPQPDFMIPRTSLIIAEDNTTWYEIWNQVFTVEFEEQYYTYTNSTNQTSTIPTQIFTFGFGKVIDTDERPEMPSVPPWASWVTPAPFSSTWNQTLTSWDFVDTHLAPGEVFRHYRTWAWKQGQQSFINDGDVQYTRNLSHTYHVSDRVTFE